MQQVTLTTYNKLIVNYDTYEMTPSSYSNIAIDNPWYINMSSAPDFINGTEIECNDLTVDVPEDTYKIHSYTFQIYRGNKITVQDTPYLNHQELATYVTRLNNPNAKLLQSTDNYIKGPSMCTCYTDGFDPTVNDAVLFPMYVNYRTPALGYMQVIPRIQSITLMYNHNDLNMTIPEHTVYGCWQNSNIKSVVVPAGTYNYQQYMNIVWTGIVGYNIPLGYNYPYKFNHSMIFRQPGHALCFYGEEFEKLYCKLHCTYPATSPYIHSTHSPANNRCIHVPKGQWSVNNFIDAVNSNSSDCYFTLESNNKYIYISSPFRFMINPVCTMATQDTDIVEEWSTRKILIRHPQYKHFTATCTYNGQTFQSEDDYTPATFLRWIYNQTGVKCRIHNYSIICNDTITVGENPFFEFKDNVINNLCGLHTFDYNVVLPNAYKLVGIDNYNDYNPTLTTYDFSTNINTENINTTLNTSKVSLTIS